MWAPQYELLRTLQDQFDFPFPGCEAVKGHGQHVHACSGEFTPLSYSGGGCCVCVCVRVPPTPVTRRSSQFFLAPRNFSARYVGKSDLQSVLVRMEVMWEEGSVVCVVAVNCRVAARRLRAT